MRLSNARSVEFLLSRYVRSGREVTHVVDPYLDLRPRFADLVQLKAEVDARRLDVDVLSLESDYSQWWKRFIAVQQHAEEPDTETRRRLRATMLDYAYGIVGAMRLPNAVESENECNKLVSDAVSVTRMKHKQPFIPAATACGNRFEALWAIRRELVRLMQERSPHHVARLSPPCFVRPALVEACNLDVQRFPTVPDGVHFLSLVGVCLPSLISCFIRQMIGSTNRWPLTFFAIGEEYGYRTASGAEERFTQTPVLYALNLYRTELESCDAKHVAVELLSELAAQLPIIQPTAFECFRSVPPARLEPYESAAVESYVGDRPWARFALIGDYVSRRIHLICNEPKTKKSFFFVGMHLTRIDLSAVLDCCRSNWK